MFWMRQLMLKGPAASALFYFAVAAPLQRQTSARQKQFATSSIAVSVSSALGPQSPFQGSVPASKSAVGYIARATLRSRITSPASSKTQ